MNRRALIATAGMAVGAGCLGNGGGGFDSNGDGEAADASEHGVQPNGIEMIRDQFEDRGIQVNDARLNEVIVLEVQTTGDIDEDVREAAGAYATVAGNLDEDLRVRVEDRGLHQETFEVERDWARDFAEGRINDEEYMSRITETRTER